MKKFIIRALLFVSGVVVTLGGWSAVVFWMEISAYRREAVMPADTVYAICSDSQTELGLRPELWPHFFNFSQSGIELDQLEIVTYDLLSRNRGMPKVLLIDISPRKLFKQAIDTPLLEDRSAGKRFLLYLLHPEMTRRSLDGIVIIFRDSILVKRSGRVLRALLCGGKYQSSIGGSYEPIPNLSEEEVLVNRRKLLEGKAKLGFRDYRDLVYESLRERLTDVNDWPDVTMSSPTVSSVTNLIGIARSFGVTPVLMTTPMHREFLSRMRPGSRENYRAIMTEIATMSGTPYLDYLEMPFEDEDWRDANHLNRHGAVRFTERVRTDVERLFPKF